MNASQDAIQRTEAEFRQVQANVEAKSNAIEILKECPAKNAVQCQALAGIFQTLEGEVQYGRQRLGELGQQRTQLLQEAQVGEEKDGEAKGAKKESVRDRKR